MKKFLSWSALVCIGVALLVLVKFEVSDQMDRQYYEKHVATHMLPIGEKPQPIAARALVDQDEVFGQGLEMIRGAKKQVMFGMYLFGGDIGDQVIDLLLEKQKEGVEIFMLLSRTSQDYERAQKKEAETLEEIAVADEAGTPVAKPQYRQKMSKAKELGLNVRNADPGFIKAIAPARVDHSKIIIVDGVEAMFGGMNFSDTTAKNHDAMVRVAGPFVRELEISFSNNWNCIRDGAPYAPISIYDETAAKKRMQMRLQEEGYSSCAGNLTLTSPYLRNTRVRLIEKFDAATKSIEVEQLLLNDTKTLKALARAAKRGVKVRLLVDPAKHLYYRDWKGGPNNKAVGMVEELKREHPELPIEVRHYTVAPGQELHVKMCIIDEKTLGMGSTNFSSGAFQSNYELFAFIEGTEIVGDFLAMFETDWKTRGEPAPKLNLGRKIISIFSDVIF
ncbi:phosphatidylserine/phosphatidylglycerophosphate/cardiolipin synthase family protein [Opitutales bacterium]|jgi:phosphatidylserine/phosphatidylglycerophosphate/cardiolipin synthase-like enzyme|nr:phosphatidylserine/phosphatidylglycerophosphate/cardiolipin synthase family protein [Opitutales bacterium]